MEILRQVQENSGAIFSEDGKVPLSFPHDQDMLGQILTPDHLDLGDRVLLCDRSHWGLIKVSGNDRLRYLHNQSTNDFNSLKAGAGGETVFVTSTARTIDLASAYVTENEVLLLVSPRRIDSLIPWLDRFIFPMDKVVLTNLSNQYGILTLLGEQSDQILQQLGYNSIIDQPEYSHQIFNFADQEIRIIVDTGLKIEGYTLLIPHSIAPQIWSKLIEMKVIAIGEKVWEILRIRQGKPVPDQELTEEFNPLEAGLWHTISFNKGCYIGQETIARLNTYKGVKQRLWGIKLNTLIPVGETITLNGEKIGKLTSIMETPQGIFGLAYIRTKAGGEGLKVTLGKGQGEIIPVPYLTHQGEDI